MRFGTANRSVSVTQVRKRDVALELLHLFSLGRKDDKLSAYIHSKNLACSVVIVLCDDKMKNVTCKIDGRLCYDISSW